MNENIPFTLAAIVLGLFFSGFEIETDADRREMSVFYSAVAKYHYHSLTNDLQEIGLKLSPTS